MKSETLYYDFCLGIPDEHGTCNVELPDGKIVGGWKEKGVKLKSIATAMDYAKEKGYPYFERVFLKGGERWREPYTLK